MAPRSGLLGGDGGRWSLAVLVHQTHRGFLGSCGSPGYAHIFRLVGLLTLDEATSAVGLPGRIRWARTLWLLGREPGLLRFPHGLLVGRLTPAWSAGALRWGVTLVQQIVGAALLQRVLQGQLVGVWCRPGLGVVGGAHLFTLTRTRQARTGWRSNVAYPREYCAAGCGPNTARWNVTKIAPGEYPGL